jgi:catechol 2,3-dioxygenase-like lactoylglutathione lyase family enzyme
MQITTCLHVAVNVTDLEKAEYFYSNVLGLQTAERILRFPGIWYQVGAFQVHLIAAPAVPANRVNTKKWGRNPHIAFSVSNLEEAKVKLLDYGAAIQISASGRAALFTEDPDGNLIELSEAQ